MATGRTYGLMRQLGDLLTVGTGGELTDGQLLERFATLEGAAAEQAFSALVERHGPMVLRVCRGSLADSNDAEDAFQATFLVLVKKARSLWVQRFAGPVASSGGCPRRGRRPIGRGPPAQARAGCRPVGPGNLHPA